MLLKEARKKINKIEKKLDEKSEVKPTSITTIIKYLNEKTIFKNEEEEIEYKEQKNKFIQIILKHNLLEVFKLNKYSFEMIKKFITDNNSAGPAFPLVNNSDGPSSVLEDETTIQKYERELKELENEQNEKLKEIEKQKKKK